MPFELFPYQEEGIKFLAGRKRALLLDAPGLGKTVQAIRAADLRGVQTRQTVCPASVVTQWSKNHAALTTKPDSTFAARSYEAARDKGVPAATSLVLDELHFLKNAEAQRTHRILGREAYATDGLIYQSEICWGLSGSLAPKDPSDLWAPLRAIVPGALWMRKRGETMDYWSFVKTYCEGYEGPYGFVVKAGKNLDELKERMAPYVLRRTKKEVMPEWKEPLVAELWLDPGEARDMLTKAELGEEGQRIADAFKKGGFEALAVLAERDTKGVSRYRRYTGILKVLPIVKWLLDQFGSGLEKIVLICVHREVIEGIHAKLKEHGIGSVIYYGGMTSGQKDAAKNTFLEEVDCRTFIGQINSAGTGLDGLQHATGDMLFVEWSWIADENAQAIARLDRIGQENPVLARFAGFEGSLDGSIMASASRRATQNEQLFG